MAWPGRRLHINKTFSDLACLGTTIAVGPFWALFWTIYMCKRSQPSILYTQVLVHPQSLSLEQNSLPVSKPPSIYNPELCPHEHIPAVITSVPVLSPSALASPIQWFLPHHSLWVVSHQTSQMLMAKQVFRLKHVCSYASAQIYLFEETRHQEQLPCSFCICVCTIIGMHAVLDKLWNKLFQTPELPVYLSFH